MTAPLDQLSVLVNQGARLAFGLDEVDVAQQFLARRRCFRRLANQVDHVQHVQQNTGIVAAGMAEHSEGATEQLNERHRFQDQARFAILVAVMGVIFPLPDEGHQAIAQMIQAGHGRKRVIDRRRHGAHRHFGELVDRVADILGRCAHIPDLDGMAHELLALRIDPTGGPNQGDHHTSSDKVAGLVQQADDQVFVPGQGQQELRIDELDVTGILDTERIACRCCQGFQNVLAVGAGCRPVLPIIVARTVCRVRRADYILQFCARPSCDIRRLQHGADVLDQQDQRGKGCQHQVQANRGSQLWPCRLHNGRGNGKGARQAVDEGAHEHPQHELGGAIAQKNAQEARAVLGSYGREWQG